MIMMGSFLKTHKFISFHSIQALNLIIYYRLSICCSIQLLESANVSSRIIKTYYISALCNYTSFAPWARSALFTSDALPRGGYNQSAIEACGHRLTLFLFLSVSLPLSLFLPSPSLPVLSKIASLMLSFSIANFLQTALLKRLKSFFRLPERRIPQRITEKR